MICLFLGLQVVNLENLNPLPNVKSEQYEKQAAISNQPLIPPREPGNTLV
jgi:hypothetical protein